MKRLDRKGILNLVLVSLIAILLLQACSTGNEIDSAATREEITRAINNDHWIFTAQNSNPQYGRSRGIVNGVYEVKFNKDTMIVNLPYFGRLYSGAGILNNRGPLDFTTTDFSATKENSKAGWVVTIRPKDQSEVQTLIFNLYETGTAQLNVTLTNRSPISFTGYVRAVK